MLAWIVKDTLFSERTWKKISICWEIEHAKCNFMVNFGKSPGSVLPLCFEKMPHKKKHVLFNFSLRITKQNFFLQIETLHYSHCAFFLTDVCYACFSLKPESFLQLLKLHFRLRCCCWVCLMYQVITVQYYVSFTTNLGVHKTEMIFN